MDIPQRYIFVSTVKPQLSKLIDVHIIGWYVKSNISIHLYTELCSSALIKHTLVDKLSQLSSQFGIQIIENSVYRCSDNRGSTVVDSLSREGPCFLTTIIVFPFMIHTIVL